MAIYEPKTPELGKNATRRRIKALQRLNDAGGAQFKRYSPGGGKVTWRVITPDETVREIETREVAPYVIGHADCYDGVVRTHLQEAVRAALVNPEVSDQETLLKFVLEEMDERCGQPLREAADYFAPDEPASAIA